MIDNKEGKNKIRKTAGTVSLILIILISALVAFPPDFVEKIETYLLGSSHINMMEISGKKVGRGWRSFDLDYLNKEEWEHSVIYLDFPHVDGIRVYEPVEGEDLHREILPSRNILKTYYQLSHDFDSSRSIFIYDRRPRGWAGDKFFGL